jgi:hypothetical protein
MTFTEPILKDVNGGCPARGLLEGGFCRTGIMIPYGHAAEMIACDGAAAAGATCAPSAPGDSGCQPWR